MTADNKRFGNKTVDARGFAKVEFIDEYGETCSVHCSSAIGNYKDSFDRPGSSYLWVGLDHASPMIMAKDAAANGVKTDKTLGWVPFPIPDAVLTNTHMHLNREHVAGLIERLQEWLDNGDFYA